MGLFNRKKLEEQVAVSPVVESRNEEISFESGSGADVLTALIGKNKVTAEIAVQVPAVARCVDMIAGAVASLPVRLYRNDGENVEEITDDPRLRFLNGDTGDTLNADSMRRMWVRDYLIRGSAYGYIQTKNGIPTAVYYVPAKDVSVFRNDNDVIFKKYMFNVNGKNIRPYQMLKILRNSDGFGKGKGVISDNSLVLDTAYQLMKFKRNQVVKGGNKKGFLKSQGVMRQPVLEDIKKGWSKLYSNENTESYMILNGDIDFKEMSSTSVEMQLNESSVAADKEIMRLFGTADGVLSEDTVKNAVMPVIDAFEAAFDSDLLLESEKGTYYFAFDTRELTRGDIAKRYNAYAVALQNNFMQLDEVRKLEDLPALDVNFIKLGLNDVLLNPETNMIYTPNTNAWANMGEENGVDISGKSGIMESRANDGSHYVRQGNRLNGSTAYADKGSGGVDNSSEKAEDLKYKSQAEEYSKRIKGTIAYDGSAANRFSNHSARRMAERNVSFDEVKNVLKKANITYPSTNHKNARALKYGDTVVIYDSLNGIVVTVWNITD